MTTATIEDIVNSVATLNDILGKNLSGKTAYKIARIAREVNKEVELFEEEQRKIQEKFWEKNEDGSMKVDEEGRWHIAKENVSKYYEEIRELLRQEIDLNVDKVDLEELLEEKFTPKQMNGLLPFIKE